MAEVKNDGALQDGSLVLTIGSAAGGTGGTAYVAEAFTVNRPTRTLEQLDENGEPAKQKTRIGFVTGSATLQLASADAREPSLGWEFTVTGLLQKAGTPTPADVSEVFYIDSVGSTYTNDGEKKVPITFRKIVN